MRFLPLAIFFIVFVSPFALVYKGVGPSLLTSTKFDPRKIQWPENVDTSEQMLFAQQSQRTKVSPSRKPNESRTTALQLSHKNPFKLFNRPKAGNQYITVMSRFRQRSNR